jgi:cell division septal protein FtsQ
MSTVMDRSHPVSAEQAHHNNQKRNFLRLALILIGVFILFASVFLITVIYRTLKSGILFL